MNTYIVDNGSKYIKDLAMLLSDLKPVIMNYQDFDRTIIKKNDLVVLSGGHGIPVLGHDEEFKNEIELIKTHDGPIIGICLGFELIGHVFGSPIERLDKRRKGLLTISPTSNRSVVDKELTVYENHVWAIKDLREPLQSLVTSKDGVEVFKHTSKPIYGLQFHPEEGEGDGSVVLNTILITIAIERD